MCAVNIGIGHDDNLVIPELLLVEVVRNACAERHYNGAELIVADNLVESALFNVEHFSPKGKNRLDSSVSSLFGGAACGVSLNDEKLCYRGVLFRAVGKLSGQGVAFKRRFSSCGFPCLSGGFPCTGRVKRL